MAAGGPAKVIVAVHGIGDQTRYATIQTVARALCRSAKVQGAIPLGRLHTALSDEAGTVPGYFSFVTPPDPDLPGYGLAEVYWADIPREVADKKYVLEETKAWVKTIIERVSCRDYLRKKQAGADEQVLNQVLHDSSTIKQVLGEMLEGLRVLEYLVAWLQKTTKFRFPLKNLLVHYLGDVQIVAEYGIYRQNILKRFHEVLTAVCQAQGRATGSLPEIYIVAHSEGTVISFLALLQALKLGADGKPQHAWGGQVKGLMTIGSPIDKHLILWPELWQEFESAAPGGKIAWQQLQDPIPWFNYYDYGDPIGFNLDSAQAWLTTAGKPPLELRSDIGFSRYVFPGKAHNDYWRDKGVFDHFIDNVVQRKKDPAPAPASNPLVNIPSAVLPYLLVTLLCIAGAWFLYKPTIGAIKIDAGVADTAQNIGALGTALALATGAARIPRLAKAWWLRGLAVLVLAGALALGGYAPTQELKQVIDYGWKKPVAAPSAPAPALRPSPAQAAPAQVSTASPVAANPSTYPCRPSLRLLGFNVALVLVGWIFGWVWPRGGLIPLLITGVVAIVSLVAVPLREMLSLLPLWPVLLGSAGFLYFWWLAAIVFDLSFIWHRYICFNTGLEHLERLATGRVRSRIRFFKDAREKKGAATA